MLVDLALGRVRRLQRELDSLVDLPLRVHVNLLQRWLRYTLLAQASRQQRNRIALRPPLLLLVLGAVVGPVDVANVMAVEAVRVEDEEARTVAGTRPLDRPLRRL